jgi:glyoxylase-like metal-dependent hydrolase (beta-lactamase superfamily II)
MRAVALHSDLIVFVSDVWQTTCTAVRAGEEGFVIDSPVYPEELRALPEVLEHAGFPVSGLLTTHGDWDHLLGRLAFPNTSLGCAQATADRLHARVGEAQRELRDFDEAHYVEERPALGLGALQALPTPGRLSLGAERELELHPAAGHTGDGVPYWMPWLKVLVCGDYLSPVEIPTLGAGGSPAAYLNTIARLRDLVARAEWVVPGHGAPLARDRALGICAEDERYVTALAGPDPAAAPLPRAAGSRTQLRTHDANVALTTQGPPR